MYVRIHTSGFKLSHGLKSKSIVVRMNGGGDNEGVFCLLHQWARCEETDSSASLGSGIACVVCPSCTL